MRGVRSWGARPTDMSNPAAAASVAAMMSATRYAAVTSAAVVAVASPAMTGTTASRRVPAARATALLTPERDADVIGISGRHDRGGEWGDEGDEPQTEDERTREHIGRPGRL